MEPLEVTKLSSKGQVVLPQLIRRRLHLSEGVKFLVLGSGDTVILKKLEFPSQESVRELMKASRAYARRMGLKPVDIKRAIRHVRSQSQ